MKYNFQKFRDLEVIPSSIEVLFFFQMWILQSVCTGLGAIFLTGLCLIAIDISLSWIWKTFLGKRKSISSENNSLKGKHVLVTGGSKGIGKEVAKEFVKRGANVTIMARNSNQLSKASQEISKLIQHESNSSSSGSPSSSSGFKRQKVLDISVDVTSDYETVSKFVR